MVAIQKLTDKAEAGALTSVTIPICITKDRDESSASGEPKRRGLFALFGKKKLKNPN